LKKYIDWRKNRHFPIREILVEQHEESFENSPSNNDVSVTADELEQIQKYCGNRAVRKFGYVKFGLNIEKITKIFNLLCNSNCIESFSGKDPSRNRTTSPSSLSSVPSTPKEAIPWVQASTITEKLCQSFCTKCGTFETPLWRSGPDGAKTMCNACGIRWQRSTRHFSPEWSEKNGKPLLEHASSLSVTIGKNSTSVDSFPKDKSHAIDNAKSNAGDMNDMLPTREQATQNGGDQNTEKDTEMTTIKIDKVSKENTLATTKERKERASIVTLSPLEFEYNGIFLHGWHVQRSRRQNGKTAGHIDKYYLSPEGKLFRSFKLAKSFLDKQNGILPSPTKRGRLEKDDRGN